jgi:hypothetical protein
MRAIDPGRIGQCRQLVERVRHLLRRALEQPAATAGKQRVAAKQPLLVFCKIGNMAAGVARHIQHPESQLQLGEANHVVLAQGVCDLGNCLAARPEHRYLGALQQLRDAADMVSMVMCQ